MKISFVSTREIPAASSLLGRPLCLAMIAQLVYDAVLTLAYPQACAICGRSVEQRKFGVACESCWNADDADELNDRVRGESHGFTVARAAGF